MAEYIEREEVMKTVKDGNHLDFGISMADLTSLREVLEDTPAADVAEVKHGKWYITEYEFINCSECGHMHYTGMDSTSQAKQNLIDGEVPNYCPNCGARMDGEGE